MAISGRLETENNRVFLSLTIANTGAAFVKQRANGVGLNNVEQRLRNYYGDAASLKIETRADAATLVKLKFPATSEPAIRRI